MKTVASIGDIKIHQIHSPIDTPGARILEGDPTPNQNCWFPGGAMFAGMAIQNAINFAPPPPTVFQIGASEWKSVSIVPGSQTLWTAMKHEWPGEPTPQLRLAAPKSITSTNLPNIFQIITPPLPLQLIDLLRAADVPEILAITDLGLFVRNVPLFDLDQFRAFVRLWKAVLPPKVARLPEISGLLAQLSTVRAERTNPLRAAGDYYSAAWSQTYSAAPVVAKDPLAMLANAMILRMRRAAYGLTLHAILDEMVARRRPAVEAHVRFRLSPLILLSINAALPEVTTTTGDRVQSQFARLQDAFDEFPTGNSATVDPQLRPRGDLGRWRANIQKLSKLWNRPFHLLEFLCRTDLLAQHSVFVLNATELRSQGITISEALSWERSSQDLQKAFREHPSLQKLSRVLHVLVRFGATGIFHLHNSTHLSRLADLYFDPLRDDSFYKTESDGRIIGHQSVLVASLLQTITLACHRGRGGMLPVDLGPAIADALPDAIRRCQALCKFGYDALLKDAAASVRDDAPSTIPLPSDLFEHPIVEQYKASAKHSADPNVASLPAIGLTRVGNEFFDSWSIAAESLQPHMLDICHDVVLYGASRSLNLPTWTLSTFLSAFRTALRRELLIGAISCAKSVSRLVFDDPDPRNQVTRRQSRSPRAKTPKAIVRDLCAQMRTVAWALHDSYATGRQRYDRLLGVFASRILGAKDFGDQLERALTKLIADSDETLIILQAGKRFVSVDGFLWSFFDAIRLPRLFQETSPHRTAPLAYFEDKSEQHERRESLVILDRREIEGTRFVRNLIEEHLRGNAGKKPLPIAVFGPPGSGKTFAIKQIINSIRAGDPKMAIEWVEDNLAQKTEFKQLDNTFGKITEAIANKHMPVVFFDEFDSSLTGVLSWLKLFLAPMEDGTYNGKSVGRSILVFAGGTSETFRAFSREGIQKESTEWLEFSAAKGPDFVSRLRGHLDIIGINRSGAIDRLYPLRRAIVLRSHLEKMQQLGQDDMARIEDPVLKALMNVPRYRHGARSLRNLLSLFHNARQMISRSTLPPRAQAEMHVDAEAFWDLLF